jgi:apolipoprotein N-acyltransferase
MKGCATIDLRSLFLPLTGGILMALAVEPIGFWGLAWVAIVPLWIVICSSVFEEVSMPRSSGGECRIACGMAALAPLQTFRKSIVFSLAWGIGYNGIALFWITGIHPLTWMGVPWLSSLAIAIFCLVFITLWATSLVVAWGIAMTWVQAKLENPKVRFFKAWIPGIRILIGTALWCGLDALWTRSILWWPSISYTQSSGNLAILHLGQLSGHHAVIAAIVAVNGLLAEAILLKLQNKDRRDYSIYLVLSIALFIGLHGLGWSLFNRPLADTPENALKVGIIQGNVSNKIKLYTQGLLRAIAGYASGYEILAERGVRAVLTPETAIPWFWQPDRLDRDALLAPLYQAILDKKVIIWVGTFGLENNGYANSLFTVDGMGKTLSRYDKIKLVPLGEYIPFENTLGKIINRLSPLEERMIPGHPQQVFDTPFGRAIVAICYESAFPYHFQRQAAAGGEFILSAANNDHYAKSMPAQHHALDVMRAIEVDRWAVRATNTGYSAIVDPHGQTLWKSQINTYEIHDAIVYRRQSQTLYVRWGDWLTPLLLVLGAIFLVPFLG